MRMDRLRAYAMLTEYALTMVWQNFTNESQEDKFRGCCPRCCAPCYALMFLDDEGVLDHILLYWDRDDNGNKRSFQREDSDLYKDGKLDRSWLYAAWEIGRKYCSHEEDDNDIRKGTIRTQNDATSRS